MAIRIRKIDGQTVALCAAETDTKEDDIYLDDNVHHALTTKFELDFESMGFLKGSASVDKELESLMEKEKVRDAKVKLANWIKDEEIIEGEGLCDGCQTFTKQGCYIKTKWLCRRCRK